MKKWKYNGGEFNNAKTLVMGILNVTPDSFSDGGKYFSADDAVRHAVEIENEGADIIDIGAMSTRPGSDIITPEEEIERLSAVLPSIISEIHIPVSVDTFNPETAQYALKCGAAIINDVSGGFNERTACVVKSCGAGWIIMHNRTDNAGEEYEYENGIVNDVKSFFAEMREKCISYGIDTEHICFDAGFGFGKNTEDNLILLKNLSDVIPGDIMFMTALSRKRFIGEITGVQEASQRLFGTLAADVLAVNKGSDIVRVHDVRETVEAVRICDAVKEYI